jgi:hypothetical protein
MPSKRPVPAAERQRKLRSGVRTELREIRAELNELPDRLAVPAPSSCWRVPGRPCIDRGGEQIVPAIADPRASRSHFFAQSF